MKTSFGFLADWSDSTKTVALEDNNAKEKLETEIVVYAKIGEPARLDECKSKEDHIQLEAKFENGTRCRVRKVTKDGKTQFLFTFKVPTKREDGVALDANIEHTVEVDEDFFNGFAAVATRRLVKTRYNFSSENVTMSLRSGDETRDVVIPNIEYEVDVYTKTDGEKSAWCKIDIEVDNIINYIHSNHKEVEDINLSVKISHLPFAPTDSIPGFQATDAQRIRIDEIWKEFAQVMDNGTYSR